MVSFKYLLLNSYNINANMLMEMRRKIMKKIIEIKPSNGTVETKTDNEK